MSYRAVLFDFYWTLAYTAETGLGEKAAVLAVQAGADPAAWKPAWRGAVGASMRGDLSLLGRVRLSLAEAGAQQSDGALVEEIAGLMDARSVPRLYPDVRDSLSEVRARGYRMALVSNIASYRVNWLTEFEIEQHFDALVLSCEMGTLKPAKEMYLSAAEKLGVQPDECVFVDDVPPYVAAAKALGMAGVRINRFGSEEPYAHEEPTDVVPDLSIERLSQLLSWLPAKAEEPPHGATGT
jgi:putative hydrolase of the HAD superfamily